MDPITIAIIGQTILSSASAIGQSAAEKVRLKGTSVLANMQADRTLQEGAESEGRVRRAGRRALGRQRAAVAASNLALSGSALDWLQESATMAELDALNVRYETQSRADATRLRGRMGALQAEDVGRAGAIGAASSVLGGVADYGSFKIRRGD